MVADGHWRERGDFDILLTDDGLQHDRLRRDLVIALADGQLAMPRGLGITVEGRAYPDHHPFRAADVASWLPGPVLVTEKDVVKCVPSAGADHWLVPVEAIFDPVFVTLVLDWVASLCASR